MKSSVRSKKTLKVCYGYYRRSRKKHPIINLGGHYLSKFGFNIGDFVEIVFKNGAIVIRKIQAK